MMMSRKILTGLLLGVVLALSAAAQDKPNAAPQSRPDYSGTWKLNLSKSDFGPVPSPESQVDTIEHQEPSLKIGVDQKGGPQGDLKYTLKLTTDGKEAATDMGGTPAKTAARWEGDVLVVKSTLEYGGSPLTIENKYTLSKDGKTLNVASHIAGGFGEIDTTSVYDKQ